MYKSQFKTCSGITFCSKKLTIKCISLTVVAQLILVYLITLPQLKIPPSWYQHDFEEHNNINKLLLHSKKYGSFTNGYVTQISPYGRFTNQVMELLHLAVIARALNRIAISSSGLEYLPLFDLDQLNGIASGYTCKANEYNPDMCCRIRGWHYDKEPFVLRFIEGREKNVPFSLKDRLNWSAGCRILFEEHRLTTLGGLPATELVTAQEFIDRNCGAFNGPNCVTADLLGPMDTPVTSEKFPVLSIRGSMVFSLNMAQDKNSNSPFQKYVNLLQSVSPQALSYSSAVIETATKLYQYMLNRASITDSESTVAIHIRLGDVATRTPSPQLWSQWVSSAHPEARVVFIGTNAAKESEINDIKNMFPYALVGCPNDIFPQCTGQMTLAIEQLTMAMCTYFGGWQLSTYSSVIATHRLMLGHSVYSTVAFGESPTSVTDLKIFPRMDSGFGAVTAL